MSRVLDLMARFDIYALIYNHFLPPDEVEVPKEEDYRFVFKIQNSEKISKSSKQPRKFKIQSIIKTFSFLFILNFNIFFNLES